MYLKILKLNTKMWFLFHLPKKNQIISNIKIFIFEILYLITKTN